MSAASARPARTLVAAAAAFSLALLLFTFTLIRAIDLEQTEPAALPGLGDPAGAAAADSGRDMPMSAAALLLAVEHDPFAPDRMRPLGRYRLPGDVEPEEPPPAPLPPPVPPFVLYGTVVDAVESRGVALIQLGDGPARLIPVGASVGGYQLTRVAGEAAVMSNGEREIMLHVPGPQRQIAVVPDDPRQRGAARGQNTRQNATAEEVRQRVEGARDQMRQFQMVEALERARQSGAPPEVIETLERAIRQGGNAPVIFRRNMVPDTTQTPTPPAPDLR